MSQPEKNQQEPGWSTFSTEQKVGIIIFITTAVIGLGLSGFFLRDHLNKPFELSYTGEKFETPTDREERELKEQKEKDTDGDGLNDYDELNIYRTSPYLADSDSDGFDDGQELKSGDDPNCPAGQTCGRESEVGLNTPHQAADTRDPLPFENTGLGDFKIESKEDIDKLLSELTGEDIREALRREGVDEELINSLTDKELRDLFDTALKELHSSGTVDKILEGKQQ